jgi:hypothetical protein
MSVYFQISLKWARTDVKYQNSKVGGGGGRKRDTDPSGQQHTKSKEGVGGGVQINPRGGGEQMPPEINPDYRRFTYSLQQQQKVNCLESADVLALRICK